MEFLELRFTCTCKACKGLSLLKKFGDCKEPNTIIFEQSFLYQYGNFQKNLKKSTNLQVQVDDC